MDYGDYKNLTRMTPSDKILRDKAFNTANKPKYDRYQHGLTSMVFKCFDKIIFGGTNKKENVSNKELAEELHKIIIRKFEKGKAHSPFIDYFLGSDLLDMQGIRFLLCVIDVFSKKAWVIPFKDKKSIAITNAFQKILDKSNCKPN